jgi:hypothetical protein
MTLTPEQLRRVTADWSALAGEPMQVEAVTGNLYGYGTELGCLRLHYRLERGRVLYSQNLGTWVLALHEGD